MSARSTARTAYPSDAASCGGCDARWTALGAAHCAGCHRTFSGLRLFDAHRHARGDRGGCTDPETLPGIEYRDGMWRGPAMTDAERDRTRTAS